ncbi:MATE efflux family protein [Zostera marina]|uniref:Protein DETOXIFICATION n=1 Tax=Zostera marina TaxID=29655 RepID=A0A0K9NWU9_ZOSMR|nr:MATE efflux family protein [Zostera marina]
MNKITELRSLLSVSFPVAMTALIFYSRSMISTLFLAKLGELPLAAGSLAIAFANITGYSVLSGLSLGMEPICSQSFGSNNPQLLSLTLHRCIVFLISSSLPISFLWTNMSTIFLFIGQDSEITDMAQTYLYFALPDLLAFSFIHPIRIYLRSQTITRPLTLAAIFSAAVHLLASFFFVVYFDLGVLGVAAAAALSNFAHLLFLVVYVADTWNWNWPIKHYFTGWGTLLKLAAPSCASVCLEWWWYEIMIVFCGLLPNPKPTVASMGLLIQTTAFLYVFPSSLAIGASIRVGNDLGANSPLHARTSAHVSIITSLVIGTISMLFATSVRTTWGAMFTEDEEIRRLTTTVLPILGLCEIGNCPQTVACGVLRGCARPADAANVNLTAFYFVGMPVAVGLTFYVGLGFSGLWIGLLAAQICCAGLMLYSVVTTDWTLQAERAQRLTCDVLF